MQQAAYVARQHVIAWRSRNQNLIANSKIATIEKSKRLKERSDGSANYVSTVVKIAEGLAGVYTWVFETTTALSLTTASSTRWATSHLLISGTFTVSV